MYFIKLFLMFSLLKLGDVSCTTSRSYSTKNVFDVEKSSSTQEVHTFRSSEHKLPNPIPQTEHEVKKEKIRKSHRMREQRERARQKIRDMMENPHEYSTDSTERMSEEELESLRRDMTKDDPKLEKPENRWLRSRSGKVNPFESPVFYTAAGYHDKWAQAYRMLGLYIECSNPLDTWSYYNKNNNNNKSKGCKRWVIWAAYINPNYQGYGIREYIANESDDDYYSGTYGGYNQYSTGNGGGCESDGNGGYKCYGQNNGYNNNRNNNNNNNNNKRWKKKTNQNQHEPISKLDCHSPHTEWQLLGVYRENFADYFEQISKHLWYYNSYEYNVASNGLDYIGDGDCELTGSDKYGSYLYKAPMPMLGGKFKMGIYADSYCMIPYSNEEVNVDNLNGYGDDGYNNGGFDDYYGWQNAGVNSQEYTLTLFNEVYEEFKYCTLCLDYPSYQDGYFNGDGYDDDDLINQCWKFYSHDSYSCDSDCIAAADKQQTINEVKYGNKYYGTVWDGYFNSFQGSGSSSFSRARLSSITPSMSPSKANFFLLGSCIIFALSCYAFVTADQIEFNLGKSGKSHDGKRSRLKSLLGKEENGQKRGIGQPRTEDNGPSWFGRIRSAPSKIGKSKQGKTRKATKRVLFKGSNLEEYLGVSTSKIEAGNRTQSEGNNNEKLNIIEVSGGSSSKNRNAMKDMKRSRSESNKSHPTIYTKAQRPGDNGNHYRPPQVKTHAGATMARVEVSENQSKSEVVQRSRSEGSKPADKVMVGVRSKRKKDQRDLSVVWEDEY